MENDVVVELRPMNRNLATEFNEYDDGPRFAATNMPSHVDNGKINQSIKTYLYSAIQYVASESEAYVGLDSEECLRSLYTQCQTVQFSEHTGNY